MAKKMGEVIVVVYGFHREIDGKIRRFKAKERLWYEIKNGEPVAKSKIIPESVEWEDD